MVPHHAPSIGTGSHPLDDFEGFWSLVNQVSDEIKMVFWSQSDLFCKRYELIIATMDITDEECTRH